MKFHPLFSWLSTKAGEVRIGRVILYAEGLGLRARVASQQLPQCPDTVEEQQATIAHWVDLHDMAYVIRTWGQPYVPVAAWLSPNGRLTTVLAWPDTLPARALWTAAQAIQQAAVSPLPYPPLEVL